MSAPIQQSLPFEVPVRLEHPSQLGQAVVEYSPVRDILTRAKGLFAYNNPSGYLLTIHRLYLKLDADLHHRQTSK